MELFSENSNFLIGLAGADGNATTLQGKRVRAEQCDEVMVIAHLKASGGTTSASQATITVEEHTANSSGTTQTKTFDQVLLTTGSTLVGAESTKGRPTRTKYTTAQSSYQTAAAAGDKEQLVQIPIRTRSMSSGFYWLSAKITGLTAARVCAIYYIRSGEAYGADQTIDLY